MKPGINMVDLEGIVGPNGILVGGDMVSYETGSRYGRGQAACVVRPASTSQVQEIVKFCVANKVQIVPQEANTGLVGASSPNDQGTQIILSLDRHKDECSIDARNHVATVSSGVLLSDLNEKLSAEDLWFPVDLGANPTIGGMVATNTGGTRTIRYGDVRANLLSLEVVLFNPPGEVLQLGKALAKDNTGYDLKQSSFCRHIRNDRCGHCCNT